MNDMTDVRRLFNAVQALQAAEQAVRAAGAHLQASRSRLTAAMVLRRQPAEEADRIEHEAAQLIHDVVQRRFPGFGFVTGGANVPDAAQPVWVADALDGCANYLRGRAEYAVTLALVCHGEPQVGVVFDPCRNELFSALHGQGARLDGTPIRCSARSEAPQARAATVFPAPASPRMAGFMGEFGRVLRALGRVRRSGSTALELAHLAAGRIDLFWKHDAAPSDAAAGVLLVREAGGRVEARDGLPLLASRSLAASTPALQHAFGALLAPG